MDGPGRGGTGARRDRGEEGRSQAPNEGAASLPYGPGRGAQRLSGNPLTGPAMRADAVGAAWKARRGRLEGGCPGTGRCPREGRRRADRTKTRSTQRAIGRSPPICNTQWWERPLSQQPCGSSWAAERDCCTYEGWLAADRARCCNSRGSPPAVLRTRALRPPVDHAPPAPGMPLLPVRREPDPRTATCVAGRRRRGRAPVPDRRGAPPGQARRRHRAVGPPVIEQVVPRWAHKRARGAPGPTGRALGAAV